MANEIRVQRGPGQASPLGAGGAPGTAPAKAAAARSLQQKK